MYSRDDSEIQQPDSADPAEPVPRFRMMESAQPFRVNPYRRESALSDTLGLLKSFAQTQQFQLTGPLLSSIGLATTSSRTNNLHEVLRTVTGCADLSRLVRSQIGDVTVWSMHVDAFRTLYSGVIYAAPTKCRSSLITISLHRIVEGHNTSGLTGAIPATQLAAPQADSLSNRFPISFTFIRAFSLVAEQVNRAHSTPAHSPSSERPIDLTERQKEVLIRSAEGLSSSQVASLLGCAESTVNGHLRSVLKLLSCPTKPLAVLKAARLGLIPCFQ